MGRDGNQQQSAHEMGRDGNQLEEHAPLCAQSVPGGKEPQLRYFMEPPVQLISCRGAIPATSMACEEGDSRRVEHMHADWKREFHAVLSTCMLRGLMRPTGTYLEHRGQRHLTLHIPKRLTRHLTKGKLRVRRYVPETVQGRSGLS